MSGIAWKIGTYSDRRLEAEISNIYYDNHKNFPDIQMIESGNLALLWAEFDRRVAAGAMTDDEEGLLNDTRKY